MRRQTALFHMSQRKDEDGRAHRVSRRSFIGQTAGVGAASLIGARADAAGQDAPQSQEKLPAASPAALDRDTGVTAPPAAVPRTGHVPGSDLMVQVLRDLGIEYVAANPASSFEGLHESIVNHGDPPNRMPELITALHEESAVDMAHGYAKAEGVPMAVMLHATVGVQHAAMAIYQAYQSQTPIVIIVGRDDQFFRQEQTANDIAGMVRAFTKWDAQPTTLEGALADLQRAYNEAITPPRGPTVVVIDNSLQKEEAGDLQVPAYVPPDYPTMSRQQAQDIASGLLAADNPRLNVGRLRTPAGIAHAVTLAEMLGASVQSFATSGAMSFPQRHWLAGPGASTEYDYVLGLEIGAQDVSIQGPPLSSMREDRDPGGIGFGFVREPVPGIRPLPPSVRPPSPAKEVVIADAEASLPLLLDAIARRIDERDRARIAQRATATAKANAAHRQKQLRQALEVRRRGWNGSPVSLARLYAELWPHIRDENWCLSSPSVFSSQHHIVLWDHDRPYSYLGSHGGGGIGYCIGASAGAGLAARERNRIVVNIQCDGDLNYTPGALWTMAHHKLPVLSVMHNNRGYHQEVMYLHYMAGVRNRGTDRMHIGTTLREPHIDYAKLAEAYGVESEGPIEDPAELEAAYRRGVAAVKAGRPYLIDVITQPR